MTNDIFAENAWYFRNSLVRANYNALRNGIHETTEYLEAFLGNLLLGEQNPLHNRSMHICGIFGTEEKPNIETIKANIGTAKADIEANFGPKTAGHVLQLYETFSDGRTFGRSDVMTTIGIGSTRASELLGEMLKRGIIEPVQGKDKGKYRFKSAFR